MTLKIKNLQHLLQKIGMNGCLISNNVNIYYLTGNVFNGYIYVPCEGQYFYFVKSPAHLIGDNICYIYKPEQMPDFFRKNSIKIPETLLLEEDELTYSEYCRLHSVFQPQKTGNASSVMRTLRSVKLPEEIEQFSISAAKHIDVYSKIKSCYHHGISDIDLQHEIEYLMRKNGSIGIFRTFGSNMEIFMGTVLVGDNAEMPSPFDFALGGAGIDISFPMGANGTIIKEGMTVMIDMAGNYTPYQTDMSRVFSLGKIPEKALHAHNISLSIHNELKNIAKPGISCADLYNKALKIVEKEKLTQYYMGIRQQAKFIGHGIGLQINEIPVLSARSKDVLQSNMVFALEPKFVIPGVGAVGIENTWLVTDNGIDVLTKFEENIIPFDS
jgi:Xaa-Pro aminopeptidase